MVTITSLQHLGIDEDQVRVLTDGYEQFVAAGGAQATREILRTLVADGAVTLPDDHLLEAVALEHPNHLMLGLRDSTRPLAGVYTPALDVTTTTLDAMLDDLVAPLAAAAAWSQPHHDQPTPQQMHALGQRLRHGATTTVTRSPFDLPKGYLLAVDGDGFTCGIAPDGITAS